MRGAKPACQLSLAALALLVIGAFAARLAPAHAPANNLPRIGVLLPGSSETPVGNFFFDKLQALGYEFGRNIVIERRYAEGHDERLDAQAAELVHDHVQVIVAQNASSTLAAQKATHTIPIVFVSISDPLAMGLVQSLARPGGNITGIANTPKDLNQKRIEILKDAVPDLRRVAVLARAGNPNSQLHLTGELAAAQQLGLQARIYDIAGPSEFDSAFAAMNRDGMQAAVAAQDSIFFVNRQHLMDSAVAHRIPVIADGIEYADSRALIIYGSSYHAVYERCAIYVDKILKGASPAELPVDQPIYLRLIVNLKVARDLGITIQRSMLVRANEIIE